MVKALLITTDKRIVEVSINDLTDYYEHMQCDFVDVVDLSDARSRQDVGTMWVDDEFIYKQTAVNSIATDLAGMLGRVDLLMRGIKGNVIVTGPPDRNGETTSVTSRHLVATLFRICSEAGGVWEGEARSLMQLAGEAT